MTKLPCSASKMKIKCCLSHLSYIMRVVKTVIFTFPLNRDIKYWLRSS